MIICLAAMDPHKLIGKRKQLPWRVIEELQHFKKVTMNQTILMGSKTYMSLPSKLTDRNILVLTRNEKLIIKEKNAQKIYSIKNIIDEYHGSTQKDIFICGGREVYRLFTPFYDKLIISEIKKTYQGDVFFPELNYGEYLVTSKEDYGEFTVTISERK